MNAETQYKLSAADLEVVLALARTGTLADAGERLSLDASTVFRTIQKVEKGLGQRLFERTRAGYLPSELALQLAGHGEQVEAQLEAARSVLQLQPEQVSGTLRITTTDTVLHGLVAPALKALQASHPLLGFDLHAGNELASLTRRDADIAVRATKRPPQHLVGKHIGPIRVALYAGKKGGIQRFDDTVAAQASWIAPDDALPEHPSVVWRKKHFPKVAPRYRVNSILTVAELVAQGLGIGLLPVFLAQRRVDLTQLTEVLDECQTELWLLTHNESRHLRRVSAVYGYLSQNLLLE
ncbi:LysR family transcriptional regulator [Rhodoferax sp. AJA081-3]|uniref:LysR family transcriptional regulator n=1 Tax=Rhodoferax sp. AJA081-3 TaxID=2752316 RepID=UPI001ADF17B9|nr:LysR family transcriptional regulator [Rhodoferax sp. AJA081-3]QTN26425.1 LysR family transcriptional regulator [Rhodoferax sp. AJA081-3]